ncbi:MAG: ATP-binding cassette domain-containing protein [Alphaproteobacteria bacterium]|nr:ATP-binding cassette domain-containing protein [Alphaproteobacteria bacterium]
MPRHAAVSLHNVSLTLTGAAGPVNILKGVSLAADPGERLALVGPSGSGKSSLLALIAGLERPTAGTIAVAGQDLGALDEDGLARFRRRRIGIVFQAFHLIPTMTAAENVALPLELAGARDAGSRADAALAAVGLWPRRGHHPLELSGGEQQRVALARAIVGEPALLLADEPTGNLDSATGTEIADLLFALADRTEATLVIVTHNQALATRCLRTLHLDDGRIVDGKVD